MYSLALYYMTVIILNFGEIKIRKQEKHIKVPIPYPYFKVWMLLKYIFSYALSLLSWFSNYLLLSARFFIYFIHQKLGKLFVLKKCNKPCFFVFFVIQYGSNYSII